MINKLLMTVAGGIGAVVLFSGCTSVESTQKLNSLGLSDRADKVVSHTFVAVPCYYLWGLPLFGGSAIGDGKMSAFQDNATNESVMYLLTKELRAKGAARVINAQSFMIESMVFPGLISKRVMQASGTGVRSRNEAMDRAGRQFDQEPMPLQ